MKNNIIGAYKRSFTTEKNEVVTYYRAVVSVPVRAEEVANYMGITRIKEFKITKELYEVLYSAISKKGIYTCERILFNEWGKAFQLE